MFFLPRRLLFHPSIRHRTTSESHLFTDLTLDEASSTALARMMVCCPQLTELVLTGTYVKIV
jgi:hypothetical protein